VAFHRVSSKQFRQVLSANTPCFIAKCVSGFLCGIILSDHHHHQYWEEGRNRTVLCLHFKALYEIFAKIGSRIWLLKYQLHLV